MAEQDELDRLSKAATQGEWRFAHDDLCSTDQSDGDDLVIAAFGRSAGLRSHQYSILRGKRQREELVADAELIVHLVNLYRTGNLRVVGEGGKRASETTYMTRHNPNCPRRYEVRLPNGALDGKPLNETRDFYGHGDTFEEAFSAAMIQAATAGGEHDL